MHIVFFTHPLFLGSQSMPRYAHWLAEGMQARGHQVELWQPRAKCYNWPVPARLKKWMGYIDQYIIFLRWVKQQLKKQTADTLYVFTDHALGPWVPLVKELPHIIHCHDFLAQRSALGEIPENCTGRTGKIYQAYIRQGYRQGRNFISISQNTQRELHRFLGKKPEISELVYNGLTGDFHPSADINGLRQRLSAETDIALEKGYLLHVGGNQWYKNRRGVVALYNAWRNITDLTLPLLLVGSEPDALLTDAIASSPFQKDIRVLTGKDNAFVRKIYAGAALFLFPSLAEGFGWPVAEAMASGVPVLTTGEAPMTEVGADAAFYLERMPAADSDRLKWAEKGAILMEKILHLPIDEKAILLRKGLENVKRFDSDKALDTIEAVYKKVLSGM